LGRSDNSSFTVRWSLFFLCSWWLSCKDRVKVFFFFFCISVCELRDFFLVFFIYFVFVMVSSLSLCEISSLFISKITCSFLSLPISWPSSQLVDQTIENHFGSSFHFFAIWSSCLNIWCILKMFRKIGGQNWVITETKNYITQQNNNNYIRVQSNSQDLQNLFIE